MELQIQLKLEANCDFHLARDCILRVFVVLPAVNDAPLAQLEVQVSGSKIQNGVRFSAWEKRFPFQTHNEQTKSVDDQLDDARPKVDYKFMRNAQGELISGGVTGIVELIENGTALKTPYPGPEMDLHIRDIAKEADIYHRIGPHKRLARMLDHPDEGLVLEFMRNGDLKTYLQSKSSIPIDLKVKWAYQVAEAVDLLHKNDVIHCDIKPRNTLLDTCFDTKIIDFSGSSLDGSRPTSGESTRFFLPRHWKDPSTVATDLFALGSTIYEAFYATSPYRDIASDEVERLYNKMSSLVYQTNHGDR
ncbi:kinase domain-containing protein [Penicillium angulare]|uniref:kinase domain-containing protein n=1 Tax=Penicillium angulare TaxID=116970 RepID=UPI00253FF8FF|nr:kinase domain-containing protein [Penicillium angulare]KAJ5291937.1 kinase domain-containing protein [Penicillium angulare]